MVEISEEYCRRCERMQPVYSEKFIGGINWFCLECKSLVDRHFDFDDLDWDYDWEEFLK